MRPIRCYAGQFFGGYPYMTKGDNDHGRVLLKGVKLIMTSTAADTATELEVEDWNPLVTTIKRDTKTYQQSKTPLVFHHRSSADDSSHFFEFSEPIEAFYGLKTKVNTNCRPIYFIR